MRWTQSAVLEQACRSAPLASPLTHFLSGRLCSCSCTSPCPVHDKKPSQLRLSSASTAPPCAASSRHLDKVVLTRIFNCPPRHRQRCNCRHDAPEHRISRKLDSCFLDARQSRMDRSGFQSQPKNTAGPGDRKGRTLTWARKSFESRLTSGCTAMKYRIICPLT